jgi:hypothetical protein
MEGYLYEIEHSAQVVAIDTGGVMLEFAPSEPVQIIRWGCIVTVATTADVSILTADHEQAGGAALTPSGAADLGTVTVPISAVGLGYYKEMAVPFLVIPGEQVQISTNGGATAGDAMFFIHYKRMNFQDYTVDRQTYDALTTPLDSTQLANLTKVTV